MKYVLAVTSAFLMSTTAYAEQNNKIEKVLLSSGGLAQLIRQVDIPASGTFTIDIPRSQVDDVLKSLIIMDADSQVQAMALDGPDQTDNLSVDGQKNQLDMASLEKILNAYKGSKIRYDGGDKEVTIVAVETQILANGEKKPMLTVMDDNYSIFSLPLWSTKVQLTDEKLQNDLVTALKASNALKRDVLKSVEISLRQKTPHPVEIAYVVAAPIWKTAYRLVKSDEGKTSLQAWAVLENTSGEDWKDVTVTLSSGKPNTLRQELLKHYWKARPEVQVDDQGAVGKRFNPNSRLAKTNAGSDAMMEMKAAVAPMAAASPMPMEMSASVQEAVNNETVTASTFTIPEKVTLADGKTLAVPIIDRALKPELVSIYTVGENGLHPKAAALIKNDSSVSLPEGILTVYDADAGYVGDAKVENFPLGQEQDIVYASDQKVSVNLESKPAQQITSVKIENGIIHFERKVVTKNTYHIKSASDAERTLIIQQAQVPGSKFISDYSIAAKDGFDRMQISLKKGDEKTITSSIETQNEENYAVSNLDPDTVELYLNQINDPETRKKLENLSKAQVLYQQTVKDMKNVEERMLDLSKREDSIRENIRAVPAGADQDLYVAKLRETESQMDKLTSSKRDLQTKIDDYERSVRAAMSQF